MSAITQFDIDFLQMFMSLEAENRAVAGAPDSKYEQDARRALDIVQRVSEDFRSRQDESRLLTGHCSDVRCSLLANHKGPCV